MTPQPSKKKALVSLIILGPFFGEVLSMSTPLIQFILPWVLIPLIFLYGFGLLLIHEIRVRTSNSTFRVLLLGVTYGFLEEGISLKSFFNPNWGIKPLDTYGRIWNVNMVWLANVTVYHVVMSIWAPLLLIDIFFPYYQNRPLLETKTQQWTVFILYLSSLILFSVVFPYSPPFIPYLLLLLITLFILFVAVKMQLPFTATQDMTTSSIRIFISGILGFFFWVTFSWFFPVFQIPWYLSFILIWATPVLVILIANGFNKRWSKRQQLILTLGFVSPSLLLFPLLSDPLFQSISSVIALVLFILAFKKTSSQNSSSLPS